MDLPAASPFVVFTLETPRFPAALLVLAAIITWFALRYRFPKHSILAAAGLLGAAAALLALAALVETTGERLARETRSLVEAAATENAEHVSRVLRDDLVVIVGSSRSRLEKGDLVERVSVLPDLIRSNHVRQAAGAKTGSDRGESILAQTTTTHLGTPTPNEWRFRWIRGADGAWRISEIIWEKWGLGAAPTSDLLDR